MRCSSIDDHSQGKHPSFERTLVSSAPDLRNLAWIAIESESDFVTADRGFARFDGLTRTDPFSI